MRAKLKEVSVDLTDKVIFSLTTYGKEALKSIHESKYQVLGNGLVEMELWIFIKEFGGGLSLINPCPAEGMELIIRCD